MNTTEVYDQNLPRAWSHGFKWVKQTSAEFFFYRFQFHFDVSTWLDLSVYLEIKQFRGEFMEYLLFFYHEATPDFLSSHGIPTSVFDLICCPLNNPYNFHH